MLLACATDDHINLIDDHFGDAKYYDVYRMTEENIMFVKSVPNNVVNHIHPDPSKGKKILKLLMDEGVKFLINKAFGVNIKIIKKQLIPVIARVKKISDAINHMQKNHQLVVNIYEKKNIYVVLKDDEEMKVVETA